jgi:hypothetical protein
MKNEEKNCNPEEVSKPAKDSKINRGTGQEYMRVVDNIERNFSLEERKLLLQLRKESICLMQCCKTSR